MDFEDPPTEIEDRYVELRRAGYDRDEAFDLAVLSTIHVPGIKHAPKLSTAEFYRGVCKCGWESGSADTKHGALKNAAAHVRAKTEPYDIEAVQRAKQELLAIREDLNGS